MAKSPHKFDFVANKQAKSTSLPAFNKLIVEYQSEKHNFRVLFRNQRTNGPVNAHLISWPSKAQNIQNLENI